MTFSINEMVANIRKAIDDIAPSVLDSFATDVNAELEQAMMHAVESLSMELPLSLLEPTVISNDDNPQITTGDSGEAVVELDEKFIRFIAVRLNGWKGTVNELMVPGSDEEKQQRSAWSRGTPTKPKAMLDHWLLEHDESDENEGNESEESQSEYIERQVLRCWPHEGMLERLVYVERPTVSGDNLTCDLKEEAKKNIIYRAAYIFLEGKKESATADKFNQLSML